MGMTLTSKVKPYKFGYGPYAPEVYRMPFAYCYRCPFGLTYPTGMGLHWEGFGDVDCDGDLDMYLIDHQMRNIVFNENVPSSVKDKYIGMSNQLFRNDNGY